MILFMWNLHKKQNLERQKIRSYLCLRVGADIDYIWAWRNFDDESVLKLDHGDGGTTTKFTNNL